MPATRWSRSPASRIYDAAGESYELCLPCQGAADLKSALAHITGLPPERFRIRAVDVGGGFGVRHEVYPEFLALMLAAKKTGRPVKWTGTRSETISGDHHGRAADLTGELALDARRALSCVAGAMAGQSRRLLLQLGAADQYDRLADEFGHQPLRRPGRARPASAGLHQHDADHSLSRRRTSQRRLSVGASCRRRRRAQLGIDSIKLRRRNLLRKDMFPLKTPTGSTYDSADPARLLDTALQASDWEGFEQRRKAAKRAGKLRGIGLASCSSSRPAAWARSRSSCGSSPTGDSRCFRSRVRRGRATKPSTPHWWRDILGIPDDRIELRYNDVDAPKLVGVGTFGSRSLISHGAALATGAKEIVEKGRKLAAREFEVEADDVTFDNGQYRVVGTDLSISMRVLIERKWAEATHPLDTNVTLDLATAFPSGAHVAEVEIDPDTGAAWIVNYVAADDCGTIYNHKLVEGQLHGGLMQGIGQVFGEQIAYDPATGQLLSGTLHGLFHAARGSPCADHADRLRRAVAGQSARRQGRGRGRCDGIGTDARQCGPRCARAAQRSPS